MHIHAFLLTLFHTWLSSSRDLLLVLLRVIPTPLILNIKMNVFKICLVWIKKNIEHIFFCILFLNPSDGLLTTLIFLQGVSGTMPVSSWSVTKSLQLLAARKLVLESPSWATGLRNQSNNYDKFSLSFCCRFFQSLSLVVMMVMVVRVTFVLSLLSWCSYHVGGIYFY